MDPPDARAVSPAEGIACQLNGGAEALPQQV